MEVTEKTGYRYLFQNIGLLTISSFASKILAFFLVPLYTSILTTSEYGTYEVVSTAVAILLPILSLNVQEGVLRFSLTTCKEQQRKTLSFALEISLIGLILVILGTIINHHFKVLRIMDEYGYFFVLMYASTLYSQIIYGFTRGLGRVKEYAIAGVLSSIVGLSLNVTLLVFFKMGLNGYFIANITSGFVALLYLVFRIKLWNYIGLKKHYYSVSHSLVRYCVPSVFNSIGWWINDASDRFVVTKFVGIEENGIYSIAYKIPSVLCVLQTIFNRAWLLSSVKEFDPNDNNGFFSKTYNVYNAIMVFICAFIVSFTKQIARFLYSKDFYAAWKYTPFLTISIVFGASAGLMEGVFMAAKDSKTNGLSTIIGAGVNLIFDVLLVKKIGPMGAAIATVFSYVLIWVIRLLNVKKHIRFKKHLMRDIVSYLLLFFIAFTVLLCDNAIACYSINAVIILLIVALYRQEIITIYGICKTQREAFR